MSILKLKFNNASVLAGLLPKIVVKGAGKNIHKSRVQKWLIEQLEDFEKHRQTLLDEFVEKDEKGNKVAVDNNMYKLADKDGYNNGYKNLVDEFEAIIDGSNDIAKKNALITVRDILVNHESLELTVSESLQYAEIVDIFESCVLYPTP